MRRVLKDETAATIVGRILRPVFKRMVITMGCALLSANAYSADLQVPVVYPKDNSVVGNKVNIVLDPAEAPMFRVEVNGTTSRVVDTSQGAHALQGLALLPGMNVITVSVLSPAGEKQNQKEKQAPKITSSRSIKVFNSEGFFGVVPAGFTRYPFHTRERESSCDSCHRMEASAQDINFSKPADVLCYTCHQEIPKGKEIHGPAALWNCLACHNPELYPAKYAFTSVDPWKVAKSTQSVAPMVFTYSTAALFDAGSATLMSKAKAKEVMADMLAYVRENPSDKVRLEVHVDGPRTKGGRDNQALSAARARSLADMLKETGIGEKKVLAVGMGEKLPKSESKTPEARELNNRVEIVVHPADVKVTNSQNLPVLKDRERVVVNLNYSHGPQIRKLRIVEPLPKGFQYVTGSGYLKNRSVEPRKAGSELIWDVGDMDANFSDNLYYTVKKANSGSTVPQSTRVAYRISDRELVRDFDPEKSSPQASTIAETCKKCHPNTLARKFKHGPAAGGYCTLCHDPHASANDAWIRKPVWDLCTTCHPDQGSGVHVVVGYIKGYSHPTRGKKDRARPGKSLSCVSCHDPHQGEHPYLLANQMKNRFDLCKMCHKK